MTRSILEYLSSVLHSQLNKGQINEMERVQRRCLKAIYGYVHHYTDLLKLSGLSTLQDRRQKAFEKFATNTAKNPKYAHWFPERTTTRFTRSTAKYKEEKAVGNRLYTNPIYAMRRYLNNSETSEIVDLTGLFTETS